MEHFRRLGINEHVLRAISEERFEKPSSIQEKTIPLILAGKDVIASSATGSGKTLAFGTGIIHIAERGKGIQALVLTPTRELAEQNMKALKKFSRYKPINVVVVYGGVSINPQIENLSRADVVIATPGRMLDHIGRRTVDLRHVKMLVLDEADRMFDMGFIDDVKEIIHSCPAKRQTLLFSATIFDEVADLAAKYMSNPVEIFGEAQVDPRKLAQVYYEVPEQIKFSLLVHLLKHERKGLAMVFCNTRRTTDFVANNLRALGINAFAIHGGFSQDKRNKTMENFHSQSVQVLVCTDVAARGLDIKGVSHVYNYDIPKDSKEYVHRIGRTARAGKEGKAINLLSEKDHDNFSRVLRDNDIEVREEKRPYIQRVQLNWRGERRTFSRGPPRRGPRADSPRHRRRRRY
ncbi:DEAD/DEAH box helicase [Candidatus Woesearchaeota archaeon]|nr:DEAD/DEAH box helicase [Candidatus Woesearchaeota archaeon]